MARKWFRKILTPRQKDAKFRDEIIAGTKLTADRVTKVDKNGIALGLTPEQAAWRKGYIQRGRDNAKLYEYMKKKGAPAKPKKSKK